MTEGASMPVTASGGASGTRRWPPSLKTRMALGVACLMSCALALSGWMYTRHFTRSFTQSVTAQQSVIVDRLAGEIAGKLEAQRDQLERFAATLSPALLADSEGMAGRLKALGEFHPYLDDFWVVDAAGHVVADYPPVAGRRGTSVVDREYFKRLLERREFVISEPTVGRYSGQSRVILFAPLRGLNGEFIGAVGGVIRLQSPRFLGALTRQRVGEKGYVGVNTAGGVVLAHPDFGHVMERIAPGAMAAVDRMRAGFEGTFEANNRDGVPSLYTTRRIGGTDWFAYAAYPVAEAYGNMQRDLARLAAFVALLAVGGGLGAWLLMSRLLAPLSLLDREMRRIANSPDARLAPADAGGDEIGQLTQSFNRMLRAQEQAETERTIVYEQIHQTGRMFEALHERAPLGMALLRGDGAFLRVNPAFQKITGYTDDELAGMIESQLSAPEFADADRQARLALAETGAVAPYEKAYITRGGIHVPVRVSAVVAGDAGANDCVWWLVEDITARRQMMDALRASEAEARMLSAAASHTRNMVLITDAQCRVEWVNASFEKAAGFSLAEMKGQVAGHLLQGPDTDPATVAVMRAAIAAREAFSIEVLNYARDGRAYWVAIDCTPVFDHLGRLERFVAMERDITSTRELHAELKASEEKHRRIFEAAREVIWEFDHHGRITLLNPAWERLTGHSIADTLGRHFVDFMVDNQRTAGRQALQAINEGGAEEFNELGCFITRAGEERWFEIRARAYRRAGGERFCVGSLHDVHERRMAEESRRAAEEALRESQERYARAIEAASDAIWEHDRETGRFYVSDRFAEMLRLDTAMRPTSPEEVFSQVHPDDLVAHLRHLDAMATSSDTVTWESRFQAGDGSYRWLRIRGRAIRDAGGVPVLTSGTASDVHDARIAGEELRAMQVRYQRAMDGSNDGVFERNMRTDEFYFSDRFDEILGYPPGGMPRQRDEWIKTIHPDDRKSHADAVDRLVAGNAAVMWEVRFRTARGEYRWLRLRGIATRDARGVPFMTSGTASDIHLARLAEDELTRHRDNLAQLVEERTAGLEAAGREAERQREEAEAARQIAVDANLAKSEFLANMSHELRTPMHAIISFANFGVEKIDRVDAAKLLHYFHNIKKSGSRLLSLLNDLLDLSKLEAGKMQMSRQPSDLGGLIGEAIAEVELLARSRDIDLRSKTLGPATASIDNMRMLQVLRNLLSNAIKFTPEGGAVRVECAFVPYGGFDAATGSIEISVSDNGLGIPENELEAVFDKFVQSSKTKTGAGGTGLGLAICREIVTAHGGTIHAFNNPSPASGATFVVRLPAGEPARVALPEQFLN